MEQALLTGVTADQSVTLITLSDLPDTPLALARTFRILADAKCRMIMVQRSPSRTHPGHGELSVAISDHRTVLAVLREHRSALGCAAVCQDQEVATVSLLGAGLRTCQGLTATFCAALSAAGVDVELLSISDTSLSALCRPAMIERAVAALCQLFELRLDQTTTTAQASTATSSLDAGAYAGSSR